MKENQHLENLTQIRSMMERSSRFVSISGLSGILMGLYAITGVYAAYRYLGIGIANDHYFYLSLDQNGERDSDFYTFFYIDAAVVLIISLITAYYFSVQRAIKLGVKIWDSTSKRMSLNLLIPLFTGGIFCIIITLRSQLPLVPGSMLVFYGLALVNASKYSLNDFRYLGLIEIALGLIALSFTGFGLLFWATGFGLMHIVYGAFMYNRYERLIIK